MYKSPSSAVYGCTRPMVITAACRYMYLCNARMWPPSCAGVCCGVLCRAVQCWEAKASGSHLLLRHFLQLLLSREIAAPKLLNPASLPAIWWRLRCVSLPGAVATTSFLVLLIVPMGEPRSGIGLSSGRSAPERVGDGEFRWSLAAVLSGSRGMRKEAHDTEGNL